MTDTSWIEIDLTALRRNVAAWRDHLARAADRANRRPAKLCAVVKADAYGLGAGELARAYEQAGADMLAVYSPAQADEVLRFGVRTPLLILMPLRDRPRSPQLLRAMNEGRVHLTVDAPDQLLLLARFGRALRRPIPVHLALDTGMCRGGLDREQFAAVARRAVTLSGVRVAGAWTHFAAPDEDAAFTADQFARFESAVAATRAHLPADAFLHAAATRATLADDRYHLGMVRLGLGLLGYNVTTSNADPGAMGKRVRELTRAERDAPAVRPILRWRSRIAHVRRCPAGSAVGYGCTHRLKRDSYLGLIPAGYADGYPLALSSRSRVALIDRVNDNGRPTADAGDYAHRVARTAAVVGRINMDQIIVDLTPPAPTCDDANNHAVPNAIDDASREHRAPLDRAPLAQVGDVVELISADPASPCALPALAELAQSSCYEMLCRLNPRLPRVYRDAQPPAAPATSNRLVAADLLDA